MFKNYFKTAWRSVWKQKTFSLLNIAGLATGIACAALIFLWVEDELTYNHYFKKRDHLYQVMENQTYDGKTSTFASLPGLFAGAIKNEVPGIKSAVRTTWGERILFTLGDKSLFADGLCVDQGFFNMFNIEFVKGNAAQAFSQLHTVVLTESLAKKIFNSTDVAGKILRVDNKQEYLIGGVIKNLPANARFSDFEWYAPFAIFENDNEWINEWSSNGIQTYVETEPSANIASMGKQLHSFILGKDSGAMARPLLLSANDWRLRSNFIDGQQSGGRIRLVNLFATIAWIILVLACINFMNLATARSEKRAREVGVRKVMGSGRGALIWQFITEAMLMSFLSVLLSVAIIILVLPMFNTIVEKELQLQLLSPLHLGWLLLIGLFCGLVAGSYPAFYLSSFNPIAVLKSLKFAAGGAHFIRKSLVVSQFVISVVLITATIIIYQQIMHTKNRELGLNKDNLVSMRQEVISVQGEESMKLRFESVKNALLSTGVVENAALSNSGDFNVGSSSSNFEWKGKDPTKEVLISMEWATPGYINTMGMQIVAGRDFHNSGTSDSLNVIVNEAFAKIVAGSAQEAVGKVLQRSDRQLTITGVTRNYVYGNIYTSVSPLIIFCDHKASNTNNMMIRLKPGLAYKPALAKVEAVMKKFNPVYPFEYRFMDESFKELFESETLIGTLAALFAGLAIFISCLGLFGLAAYTAERRVKEIGIRKVLGASVMGITTMLSKDFLQLVTISCVLAFPTAWFLMHHWLQNYEYRIAISWWMFVLPALVALLIALVTVSLQAVKAAVANPVRSLRAE